jgi:transposase
MERRKFSREFKLEAVKLIRERGVSVAQAARDLGVHENVLRKWVRGLEADPQQAFPGHGQMKPEQLEIDRLRKEVANLKAERDILKEAAVGSTDQRNMIDFVLLWKDDPQWRTWDGPDYRWSRSASFGRDGSVVSRSAISAERWVSMLPRFSGFCVQRAA